MTLEEATAICLRATWSGKEICEVISFCVKHFKGKDISPNAIWNMSPTGELYQVYGAFNSWRAKLTGIFPYLCINCGHEFFAHKSDDTSCPQCGEGTI